MGENSKIEWTDHTFNPWMGCTKVSPACDGCYAEAMMDHRYGKVKWGPHGERVRTVPSNWKQPIRWDKEAKAAGTRPRVFCASLADVFDNQVPPEWRVDLFALIRATPNLIWLLLTKRPQNIVKMVAAIGGGLPSNAALGASVEDQQRADANVPALLHAKAECSPAFVFLSCEPLLGMVSLRRIKVGGGWYDALAGWRDVKAQFPGIDETIDWVIAGGETDQGQHKARPSDPAWVRSLRYQCSAAGVAFHFKQWGEWADAEDFASEVQEDFDVRGLTSGNSIRVGKKAAGRLLDGVEHNGFPQLT